MRTLRTEVNTIRQPKTNHTTTRRASNTKRKRGLVIFLTRFGIFFRFLSYVCDYYRRPDPFGTCEIRTCYRKEPSFAAHEYKQHKQDNSNRTNEIVAAAITEIINILLY